METGRYRTSLLPVNTIKIVEKMVYRCEIMIGANDTKEMQNLMCLKRRELERGGGGCQGVG